MNQRAEIFIRFAVSMIPLWLIVALMFLVQGANAQSVSAQLQAEGNQIQETRPWTLTPGYSVFSDFADKAEPRVYTNILGINAEYRLKSFTVNASGGVRFQNQEQEVDATDDGYNGVDFTDPNISLMHTFGFRLFGNSEGKAKGPGNILISFAGWTFPMAENTQFESLNGAFNTGAILITPVYPARLFLSTGVRGSYFWHTFESSPQTGALNRELVTGYSFGARIRLFSQLFLGHTRILNASRFYDGTTDLAGAHVTSLTYNWKRLRMQLSHRQGTYLDQSEVDLWFVDQYRKIYTASIAYIF